MQRDKEYIFVAIGAAGLEKLIAEEVTENGGILEKTGGGFVQWHGGLESGYRMCLWSRFCSKVLLRIHTFALNDFDDIYRAALQFDWSVHTDHERSFCISTTLAKDAAVSHSHYATQRLKDGIVDYFKKVCGMRPDIQKERADVPFYLHVEENQGLIYVDLSGDSLHKRGYRKVAGPAPIRENLAAAICVLSGWQKEVQNSMQLVDPMCGSGTLLIEAALLWGDSAPGLSRKYFGFMRWLGHDEELWSSLIDEAVAREEIGFEKSWPEIIGYDCDNEIVAAARKNIISAGLEEKIVVECREAAFLERVGEYGFVLSNLPYGERLSDKEDIRYIYTGITTLLQQQLYGWSAGLLVMEADGVDQFPLHNQEKYRLYNGSLPCRLLTGKIESAPDKSFPYDYGGGNDLLDGRDLFNRLVKNHKKRVKWLEKSGNSCYRIYDRDLPEYNITIDVYEKYFLVQEYAPSVSVNEDVAKKRLSVALHVVRKFFKTGRERVFVKKRERQRGKEQYRKTEGKGRFYRVSEGGCTFLVNFTQYLDCGLFLDHRPIREIIEREAKGKHFLNLYGYTGTASVHAAKGGALSTTTVDLSSRYLQWARNNFLCNGFCLDNHHFMQQDCFEWLRGASDRFDLIFIDPPTFSNTKKKRLTFDIQRDHSATSSACRWNSFRGRCTLFFNKF